MSKNSVNDWSTTPASNTDIAGTNINVGCAPSDVGVYMRTAMAQIADCRTGDTILDSWYVTDAYITTLHLTNPLTFTNLTLSGYEVIGSPTGGNKGAGTINAEQVWDNGTRVMKQTKASPTICWAGGGIVANGTYVFTLHVPGAGTVDSLTYKTGNGSFTCNVRINGTSVTSLSALSVTSSTKATTNATGADTFAAGDTIDIVITSATSSPTDAALSLNVTYTP